jgi:hypothetical protein
VDVYGGVERCEFALVEVEMGGCEVADVDCEGAMACELVCGGATDANGGICAWNMASA